MSRIFGPVAAVGGPDRWGQFAATMILTQTYYVGDRVKRDPLVGEVYSAGAVISIGYPPRGMVAFRMRLTLPSGTRFADEPPGPLTDDGSFDLGVQDWSQGRISEIQFRLISDAESVDGQLGLRTESEYGTTFCSVPIGVYRRPGPPSGRLAVRVEPTPLPLGPRPASFTVVLEDKGSFTPVPGLVDVWNFLPDANRSRIPMVLPTNVPTQAIFYLGPIIFGTIANEQPTGKARALAGYEQDRGIEVPFQFDSPKRPWWIWSI